MFDQTMLYFDEIPEMGKAGKSTWEFLKSLSAGTYVTGSEKYEKSFTYFFKAKIILNCNILPTKGTDASHGFFRRLLIVPFNAKFTKEDGTKDSTIVDKIKEAELPGILNWAIEGYKRLKANDWNFSNSETVNNAIDEFKTSSDTIGSFVRDWLTPGTQTKPMGAGLTCELNGGWWINLNQLYVKYKEEQIEGNRGVHSFDGFMTRLKAVLSEMQRGVWVKVPNTDRKYTLISTASKSSWPDKGRLITLDRRKVDGKRIFVLHGVSLLTAGSAESF